MTEVWLQEGREGLRDDDSVVYPAHISGPRVKDRPPETNCLRLTACLHWGHLGTGGQAVTGMAGETPSGSPIGSLS